MVFGWTSATPYKGQVFNDLKKQAQISGELFTDAEFPANDQALFSSNAKLAGIEWKRPKDICDDPKLFVEGVSSNDLNQGALGNCWFVAACSCLAVKKELWTKVIPDHKNQEWDSEHPENYCGMFHFQFWHFGEWLDVVIDDLLPVRGNKLVFIHSKSRNEFWSALLEKAYAKLFGSYEQLDGGELAEALEDFTGGVAEPIDLVQGQYFEDLEKREGLFKVMRDAIDNHALLASAIPAKSADEMEQAIDVGLVKGHAYGITAVKKVALEGSGLFGMFHKDKLTMVRLRNPWGESEWKGAFSDGSEEWNKIDQGERDKIGLTFDDDGEFWMTMEDYCKYFITMSICRVVNLSMFSMQKKWHAAEIDSEWRTPNRSGGCVNNKETFLLNPQFLFDVITEPEDEVLIALTQKVGRTKDNPDKLTIGFSIMKVEENRAYRVNKIQEMVKSSAFRNSRSVFLRHTLPKGRYCLIACTFDPGHSAGILLRVYTSASNNGRELIEDKPTKSWFQSFFCCPICSYPSMLTKITVLKAAGLENQDTAGGADPYCIIKCEGQEIRTKICKDTLQPEWNTSAIFYRKQPMTRSIKLEIWNSNVIRDTLLGCAVIEGRQECEDKIEQLTLAGRGKDKGIVKPGKVAVKLTISRLLTSV